MGHRKAICMLAFSLLLFVLGFLSCSKKGVNLEEQDKFAILHLIDSSPDIFCGSVTDTTTPDTSGLGKIYQATADTVKAWWRRIIWSQTQRSVQVDVYPEDSIHAYPYANVSVTDTLYGFLRIIRRDSLGTWSHVSKPLKDVAKRSAYFERRGPMNSPHRGWRLIEVSGLLVESVPCSRGIDSVQVVSSNSLYNATITQDYVTDCNLLENLFSFDLEDTVTLTVYASDATDSVYLHAYSHLFPLLFHVRSSFVNNGDGSFTGSWVTTSSILDTVAYRHAAIDVIKHSVLDGDDAYDSKIWGMIYRIKPM